MRANKTLGIGLVTLLLVSMAVVINATPWDGVPDDPTPANAIWVDPKNTIVHYNDTFIVDVLVNITNLAGFEYKLKWNSTVLKVVEIQGHHPWANAFTVMNETANASATEKYHWYAVASLPATGFTGVTSICTYKFYVKWQPESASNYVTLLDIYDDKLADPSATLIVHTTVDGYVIIVRLCRQGFPVTWKWLDEEGDPIWLTAHVTVSSIHPIENFSFNRSLGQISFNVTSTLPSFCNVTVPKLLMDGAFKVLINDTQVPSMLTWNRTHTSVYFTYSQGTHNVKIIGEIVTRIRGQDLLSLVDVNLDGQVNIVDVVIVVLRYDWEQDC